MAEAEGGVSPQSSAGSQSPIRKRHSGAHLGEQEPKDGAPDSDSGMPDFDIFPEYLRIGPWHPFAAIYLACFGAWLTLYAGDAVASLKELPSTSSTPGMRLQVFWASLALYCALVNISTVRNMGWWPYVSYTMVAYMLLNLRLLSLACGFTFIAETIRFPVLVMATVTTTVWWLVLVPIMCAAMPTANGARKRFLQFNFSPFLLNVHLINSPVALADHYFAWRPFVFWDLWLSLVFAFAYVLWYLFALDANGMHFYIILSPRPWWCIFMYSMVLGIYVGIYLRLP